jgi:hypothetical protein
VLRLGAGRWSLVSIPSPPIGGYSGGKILTRHGSTFRANEYQTLSDLVLYWESLDEPLTQAELKQHLKRRSPRIVVMARWLLAVFIVSLLVGLPPLVRVVGHALD